MNLRFSKGARGVGVGAFAGLVLTTSLAFAVSTTLEVKISNVGGTLLTPLWVGFHNGTFDIYDGGTAASVALERLAEDGNTGPLAADFLGSGAGTIEETLPGGPVGPGGMASQLFTLESSSSTNQYFSYAAMVIPSNDAFIANGDPQGIQVFDDSGSFLGADFFILGSSVLDAGTEVNDEIPANTAALEQMAPNTGVTEGGVIAAHSGFMAGGNILAAFPDGDFTQDNYQVARITIFQATAPIPEPSTGLLLGTGLIGLMGYVWRKKSIRASSIV